MTAAMLRSIRSSPLTRLWWLPAGGHGNGLDDMAWAPVLDLNQEDVPALLAALRAAHAPAYAAPVRSANFSPSAQDADDRRWRLWVGTSSYGTAEAVLLAVMPGLIRHPESGGDRA